MSLGPRLLGSLLAVALLGGCGAPSGAGHPARHARSAGHTAHQAGRKAAGSAARIKKAAARLTHRPMPRRPRPAHRSAPGRVRPALAAEGASLFRTFRCDSCHGPEGQGTSAAPPLNGGGPVPVLANPTTNTPAKLAAFIHRNMPLTHPGILTAAQADRLAAYVYYTLNRRH